jgi:hypothetical protein
MKAQPGGKLTLEKVIGLNGRNKTIVQAKKDPAKEFRKKLASPKPKGA